MAVISNVEWKIESAWVTALSDNSDLSGVTIRRAYDDSSDVSYPCITVRCTGVMQPSEWAGLVGFDIAFVELSAHASRHDDGTGSLVSQYLGAIRDTLRDVNLLRLLNETAGLTVYAATVEDYSVVEDTNQFRTRTMTVKCHATATDVPDQSSSSSSSQSSGSGSSSSSTSSSSQSLSSSSTEADNTSSSSSSISSTSESSANTSSSSESSSSTLSSSSSQSSTSESSVN